MRDGSERGRRDGPQGDVPLAGRENAIPFGRESPLNNLALVLQGEPDLLQVAMITAEPSRAADPFSFRSTTRRPRKTLESTATPCSVKAYRR